MGESITSENGRISLVMETNGNLALYCNNDNEMMWETGTSDKNVQIGLIIEVFSNPICSCKYNHLFGGHYNMCGSRTLVALLTIRS